MQKLSGLLQSNQFPTFYEFPLVFQTCVLLHLGNLAGPATLALFSPSTSSLPQARRLSPSTHPTKLPVLSSLPTGHPPSVFPPEFDPNPVSPTGLSTLDVLHRCLLVLGPFSN